MARRIRGDQYEYKVHMKQRYIVLPYNIAIELGNMYLTVSQKMIDQIGAFMSDRNNSGALAYIDNHVETIRNIINKYTDDNSPYRELFINSENDTFVMVLKKYTLDNHKKTFNELLSYIFSTY